MTSGIKGISGIVCALSKQKWMMCLLILIDDLETAGAGRVVCDTLPLVLRSLDFLLCLSRLTDDHLKVYACSQFPYVIS